MSTGIKSILSIIGTCLIATYAIPQIVMAVISFIYAAIFKTSWCDDHSFMALPTWLFVNGSVALIGVICIIICAIVMIWTMHPASAAPFVGIIILFSCFNLAWNIIGAVALFRDSMDCLHAAKPLWIVVLVNLILQWIAIAQACFGGGSSKAAKSADA